MTTLITFIRSVFAPPRHLILLVAALWLGMWLAEKRAGRHIISKEALNNLVYASLLAFIIGGRLLYALTQFPAFMRSPLSIFSLNTDLFDPAAALVAAVITGIVYGRRQRLALWSTLDALTPLFATIAIGLSLAHLAAGSAFGSPTDIPWGMELWGAIRHPSQIYELIASILILGLVWFRRPAARPGLSFLVFAAFTAGARLLLEAFRGDSLFVLGGLRLPQIIAWAVLLAAIVLFELRLSGQAQRDRPDPVG